MAQSDEAAQDCPAFLLTEFGKPFASKNSLGNKVNKWVKQAGLTEIREDENKKERIVATRSQHGVRKARAEDIAGQGGSVYEVMSVLSHSDPKTAAIYTEKVNRRDLAIRAAERANGLL